MFLLISLQVHQQLPGVHAQLESWLQRCPNPLLQLHAGRRLDEDGLRVRLAGRIQGPQVRHDRLRRLRHVHPHAIGSQRGLQGERDRGRAKMVTFSSKRIGWHAELLSGIDQIILILIE